MTNTKISYKCKHCGQLFTRYRSENKGVYCSFDCKNFNKSTEDYIKTKIILEKLGKEWIIWFTGFWEGEGSLCKEKHNKTGNYHYKFAIVQKDTIIKDIKKKFGFGKINTYICDDIYQWLFGGCGKILAFVEVMTPHVRIQKRKKQIVDFMNNDYVKRFFKDLNKTRKRL